MVPGSAKIFSALGSINAMLAVILGAFGAHGLKRMVTPDMLAIFHTGVEYQFYHALGLLAVGLLLLHHSASAALKWSGWLMFSGVILFSGSLYLLVLTDERWLGAVTPVGGVAFILSWLLMIIAVLKT